MVVNVVRDVVIKVLRRVHAKVGNIFITTTVVIVLLPKLGNKTITIRIETVIILLPKLVIFLLRLFGSVIH